MPEALKWIMRRFLKSGGWVVRRQPILVDFLQARSVDLVVDVGANVGQFASELRRWGYSREILSFEPGQDAFSRLAEACRSDLRWSARKEALGDHIGTETLNVTDSTVFSSFLPLSDEAAAYGADTSIVSREQVDITTLDDVLSGRSEQLIFLKVDTQGFEREVISGLSSQANRVVGIQLELPVCQLYQGNWSLPEALVTLQEMGFELAQVNAVNFRKDDPVSATEFDCVFRRP